MYLFISFLLLIKQLLTFILLILFIDLINNEISIFFVTFNILTNLINMYIL